MNLSIQVNPVQTPKEHFLMNFEKLILQLIWKTEWTITAMKNLRIKKKLVSCTARY